MQDWAMGNGCEVFLEKEAGTRDTPVGDRIRQAFEIEAQLSSAMAMSGENTTAISPFSSVLLRNVNWFGVAG